MSLTAGRASVPGAVKLAVILVHYHSAELARRACDALARDAAAGGLELELVLVDNGSRPQDLEILESLPARRLDPGRNLGYAGGANVGVGATSAELVAVMNPDVEVLPGCLGALAAALENGAAAAGPRFYWDRGRQYLLPPTAEGGRLAEVLAVLARRGGGGARRARRRWRRHARRYWSAREPVTGYDLSGALLAFRREAWRRAGPFDEGYRLYYEETDWLRRLRAAGLEARFVPSAEAVHLYAQSAAVEPRVEIWRLESARRFRRRTYGPAFTRLLERLSARVGAATSPPALSPAAEPIACPAWVEVSPSPLGYPAAGHRLTPGSARPADLPAEIRDRLAPGSYTLRLVDRAGRELAGSRLEKIDRST